MKTFDVFPAAVINKAKCISMDKHNKELVPIGDWEGIKYVCKVCKQE